MHSVPPRLCVGAERGREILGASPMTACGHAPCWQLGVWVETVKERRRSRRMVLPESTFSFGVKEAFVSPAVGRRAPKQGWENLSGYPWCAMMGGSSSTDRAARVWKDESTVPGSSAHHQWKNRSKQRTVGRAAERDETHHRTETITCML